MENTDIELLDPSIADKEILQYEYPNPFFIPSDGSPLKFTKTKFLAEEYKNVYILCLSDDFDATIGNRNKIKLFFEQESDLDELYGQANLVALVKGPFSLIQLKTIRSGILAVDNDILKNFNHNFYDLMPKELVCLMLQTRESTVKSWLKLYKENNNLNKFIEQKIFSGYYNLMDKKMDENLINLISKVSDFRYWDDVKNCKLSINHSFTERKFNMIKKWNLPTIDMEKELQKVLQNFKNNKGKYNNNTYPHEIINPQEEAANPFKMTNYVNPSKNDYHTFFEITKQDDLSMDRNDIEELLTGHSLSEKEKYYLICNLLVSKKYCHYVINNKNVLRANKNLFDKYKPILRYLVGYSWITLYTEESYRKTKTVESDRYVFDLDTASLLPIFPFSPSFPYLNPYFTCMISDTNINIENNINGVKQSVDYQNGIIDSIELQRRLNLFISGKSDKNLLEGIDWSNMVISGGIVAAILPKTNPLMALFKKSSDQNITDEELNRFFMEYYAKSDIDIACNHSNILYFIEHVRNLKTVLLKNLGNIKESDISVKANKTLAIFVNSKLLKEKCDREEIPFGYDYIINNKDNDVIKFYFYELYVTKKSEANVKNKKILGQKINEPEYFEIINYCKFNKVVLVVNDLSFESESDNNKMPDSNSGLEMVYFQYHSENKNEIFIKFSETLRFKIESKYLIHPFEVFRITGTDFFSAVSRFHESCVRAYIRDKQCYLLPSSITAYHCLTNIDFKYFVGKHDPICIINKYRNRGYGTIFNKMEINQFLSYIMAFPSCKKAYSINDITEIRNIIGSLDVNHEFFKPRKNTPEEFAIDNNIIAVYNAVKMNYLENQDHILKYYKTLYPTYSQELLLQRCIDSEGQVQPMKRWMIDAAYDLLN